jgi:CO dehydrogenase maturation factor
MLRALVTHLLLYNKEMLILDMEAGVEHLGRATAQAVDAFITVVEPGRRSLQTAARVEELAGDIGIRRVYAVGNKVRSEDDWDFIRENSPVPTLGYLSVNPELTEADMKGLGIFDAAPHAVEDARRIVAALEAL